jgi:MEMO1 family protein
MNKTTNRFICINLKIYVVMGSVALLVLFAFLAARAEQFYHFAYHKQKDFYTNDATSTIAEYPNYAYGGILPHHLMVKSQISSYLGKIKRHNYKTIILIGPNHFNTGSGPILSATWPWQTPFGKIIADKNLIDKLAKAKSLKIDDQAFEGEHSISGLVGFLKLFWPKAEIVPIVIRKDATPAQADRLAEAIFKSVSATSTLVLASVDFSHYQNSAISNQQDKESIKAIKDFDLTRIQKIKVDSPISIYALIKYLKLSGIKNSYLENHTNSSLLIRKPKEPGTSHVFMYFDK